MTDVPSSRYALSFTSGGLLAREGALVADDFLVTKNWHVTRERMVELNVLQARTLSSSTRLTREVIQRLAKLSEHELELFARGSYTEQRYLMWTAVCRRYEIIGDFAEEVLRERYLLRTPTVDFGDFDKFLVGKSLWHDELDELKPSTRHKLRQVLFRMLHEAGLLTHDGSIVPSILSDDVRRALEDRMPSDLRFFPAMYVTTGEPKVDY